MPFIVGVSFTVIGSVRLLENCARIVRISSRLNGSVLVSNAAKNGTGVSSRVIGSVLACANCALIVCALSEVMGSAIDCKKLNCVE